MSNSQLQVYAGDEITSVVIDPGSYNTRIGMSGSDYPQIMTPSLYGIKESQPKIFEEQSIFYPRESPYDVERIVENGVIKDYDLASDQWEYFLKTRLSLETNKDMPCLLTEPIWNDVEHRKKSLEILLEKMEFGAMYIVPQPTTVSFAMGRPHCLVVDIGHDCCSVSPVYDGLTLSKSSRRNFYAGKFLNKLVELKVQEKSKQDHIIPLFEISKKRPELVLKQGKSWSANLKNFYNERFFFQECKETLLQTQPALKTETLPSSARTIESPWGEDLEFTADERHAIAEQLFKPDHEVVKTWESSPGGIMETFHNDYTPAKRNNAGANAANSTLNTTAGNTNENTPNLDGSVDTTNATTDELLQQGSPEVAGLADLVYGAIMSSDIDIRPLLTNNIVVTGGSSYIPGLVDRLQAEITKMLPSMKIRTLTSGMLKERQYQSWLGGSILSSLGTFHQLYVGKEEYQEVGPDRLLKSRFR